MNFHRAWNDNDDWRFAPSRRSIDKCVTDADDLYSFLSNKGSELRTVNWNQITALRNDMCNYLQSEDYRHHSLGKLRSMPLSGIFQAVQYIDRSGINTSRSNDGIPIDPDSVGLMTGLTSFDLSLLLRILIGHELFSFKGACQAMLDETLVVQAFLEEIAFIIQHWSEDKIQRQIVFDQSLTIVHYSTVIGEIIVQGIHNRKMIIVISALRMLGGTDLDSFRLGRVLQRIARGENATEGIMLCLTSTQFMKQVSLHGDVLHPLIQFTTWACTNDFPVIVELLVHVFKLPFLMNHSHAPPAGCFSKYSDRVLSALLQSDDSPSIQALRRLRSSYQYAVNVESSPYFSIDFEHTDFTADQQASALRRLLSALVMVHLGDMTIEVWRQHFNHHCQTLPGKAADLMWVNSQQKLSKQKFQRLDRWLQQFESQGPFSLGLGVWADLEQNHLIENADPFGAIHQGMSELVRSRIPVRAMDVAFIQAFLDQIDCPEWMLAYFVQRLVLHQHKDLLTMVLSRPYLKTRLVAILSCQRFQQWYTTDVVQSDNPLWCTVEKFLHPRRSMNDIFHYMNRRILERES